MGGTNGFTWDAYCETPDTVLVQSYAAEFDDDHQLVTQRQRRRRHSISGVTGSPDRAGRELPAPVDLRIPEEAYAVNPQLMVSPSGQAYLLMFWQVWRRRQAEGVEITDAEIMDRWRETVAPRR